MMNKINDFFFRPLLDETYEFPIPETKGLNSPDIITYGDKPIKDFKQALKDNYLGDLSKSISLKQGYDNYIYVRGKNDSENSGTKQIYLYYVPIKLKNWPCHWVELKAAHDKAYISVSYGKNEIGVGEHCFIWENVPPLPEGSDSYCLIARTVNEGGTTCTETSGTGAGHTQESNTKENMDSDQNPKDPLQEYFDNHKDSYLDLEKLIRNNKNMNIAMTIIKPSKQDIPDLQKRTPVCIKNEKKTPVHIVVNCENLSGASFSITCNTEEKTSKSIIFPKTLIDKDSVTLGISTELDPGFKGIITCNFWLGKTEKTKIPDGANFSIEVSEKQIICNETTDQENEKGKNETEHPVSTVKS